MVTMTFQKHKVLQETLFGEEGITKGLTWSLPGEKKKLERVYAESSAHHLTWSQIWVQTGSKWAEKTKSVWRTRAWLHLAGVPAQLLPARRLILLRFRAGVGAPVEGRHCAAFAVCIKAAVRRVVCLAVPFGLLEGTDCESTHTRAQLQNKYVRIFGKVPRAAPLTLLL